MDVLAAHVMDKQAEGARNFWASLALLVATFIVGVSVLTSPVEVETKTQAHPTPTVDPQVSQLKDENRSQARQIRDLQTLFNTCQTTGSCAPATDAPVTVVRRTPVYSSDNDDNGNNPTVKVEHTTVVQEKPAPKPAKTQAPVVQKPTPEPERNNVKDTTDIVKHTVQNVVGDVSKATTKGRE